MTYYDIDQLVASGYLNIAGWAPQGAPGLVTAGGNQLGRLLGAAGMGMDELDSLDALSISGQDPVAAQGGMNPMLQQAIAQRMVQQGLVVQRERPTKAREFPLGFESPTTIAPGATATITSRPQIPFRGERLIIPSDIAGSFSVLDLRVGKNSQFTSSGAVPARTFQENAVGIRLHLDTAQISQDVTLSVQNIGGAPQTFRASLIGSAVE